MLLRGLNVVEISASGAAAWATKDLADWGADVIALEPAGGSPLRDAPPYYERDGERRSAIWQWLARGKTVVPVSPDLATTPADALALCRGADLVIGEHELLGALLGLPAEEVRPAPEGHSAVVRIGRIRPGRPLRRLPGDGPGHQLARWLDRHARRTRSPAPAAGRRPQPPQLRPACARRGATRTAPPRARGGALVRRTLRAGGRGLAHHRALARL